MMDLPKLKEITTRESYLVFGHFDIAQIMYRYCPRWTAGEYILTLTWRLNVVERKILCRYAKSIPTRKSRSSYRSPVAQHSIASLPQAGLDGSVIFTSTAVYSFRTIIIVYVLWKQKSFARALNIVKKGKNGIDLIRDRVVIKLVFTF